jgi:acetyl esterase/lipase
MLALASRSTLALHARALEVLATTLDVPPARWLSALLADDPRFDEQLVAGIPTTVVGGGGRPWPAIVFLSGASERGRKHPGVRRLAAGLARAGYVVHVPDVHGLSRGEITLRTLADAVAVARAVADRADTRNAQVALAGVSVGATLALLVAEDPSLEARVSVVAGVAPWADMRAVIRLSTTRRYGPGTYPCDPFVSLAAARSLAGGLPDGPDRDALRAHLLAVPDDADDPLAGLRSWRGARLGPTAQALVALLASRDPERFEERYAALSAELRRGVEALSPIRRVAAITAPVELASAPRDRYFPLAESESLVAAAQRGRLTVTRVLQHAVPRASRREIPDLLRYYGFLARTLRRAAGER